MNKAPADLRRASALEQFGSDCAVDQESPSENLRVSLGRRTRAIFQPVQTLPKSDRNLLARTKKKSFSEATFLGTFWQPMETSPSFTTNISGTKPVPVCEITYPFPFLCSKSTRW